MQKNDTNKIVVSAGPIGKASTHNILVLNSAISKDSGTELGERYSKINVPL
jgi:hypothetical protein